MILLRVVVTEEKTGSEREIIRGKVKPGDNDSVGELPACEAELRRLAVAAIGKLDEHLAAACTRRCTKRIQASNEVPGTSTPGTGLGISIDFTSPNLPHSSLMSSRMSSYSSSS